jgi:hypothetical protein
MTGIVFSLVGPPHTHSQIKSSKRQTYKQCPSHTSDMLQNSTVLKHHTSPIESYISIQSVAQKEKKTPSSGGSALSLLCLTCQMSWPLTVHTCTSTCPNKLCQSPVQCHCKSHNLKSLHFCVCLPVSFQSLLAAGCGSRGFTAHSASTPK